MSNIYASERELMNARSMGMYDLRDALLDKPTLKEHHKLISDVCAQIQADWEAYFVDVSTFRSN